MLLKDGRNLHIKLKWKILHQMTLHEFNQQIKD